MFSTLNVELLFLHLCHFWLLYCLSDLPIAIFFLLYQSVYSLEVPSCRQPPTFLTPLLLSPCSGSVLRESRFLAGFWLFFTTLKIIFCWFVFLRGGDFCYCFPAIISQSNSRYIEKIVLFLKNILFGMIFLPFYYDEVRWNYLYALESPCGFVYQYIIVFVKT